MKRINPLHRVTLVSVCMMVWSSATLLAAESTKLKEERGTIKSLDADAQTLVVIDRKDNSEHKFAWNDQSKFTERGKAIHASELKTGERIRVSYKPGADVPNIERARLVEAKTEKPTAEKP
jgi:hypothetical protein